MTTGLIINPRSGKHGGRGLRLQELVQRSSGMRAAVLEDFAALPAMLQEFSASGVETLAISSGDGTVQAIQTELAERNTFASLPSLLLLPHGTANMTAADLGLGVRNLDDIASLLSSPARLRGLARRRRPTLRAVNPGSGGPRHGMFIGAGSIYDGARFCQEKVYATGTRGNLAIVATLTAAIANMLLRGRKTSATRLAGPHRIRLSADGRTVVDGDQLFFLATTLERLVLGMRPFWGGKSAPVRATVIPYPVPGLVGWLWPSMYGPEDRRMPPGSVSLSAHALDVWSSSSFVIDGEFFDGPQDGPLRIETGPHFTYLCSPRGPAR
ncbi:MAG: hypothetical protein M3N38_10035 [Pseudomonadota bacterium]|nr:hypothetical protein [Pseudomonadota bacterium]